MAVKATQKNTDETAENNAQINATKNTSKYTNIEQIEARRKKLEEMKRQIEKEKKELDRSGREITRRHDRLRVAMVGRFIQSRKPELWDEITKSPGFNEYVNRESDRKVWGFQPLEASDRNQGQKTPPVEGANAAVGRLYLSVSYKEQDELKALAEEVFGAGYRGMSLDFDKAEKRWYLMGEGTGKAGAFARWLPDQARRPESE